MNKAGTGALPPAEGVRRTLAEIIEAEQELFNKVWYVRGIAHDDDERE